MLQNSVFTGFLAWHDSFVCHWPHMVAMICYQPLPFPSLDQDDCVDWDGPGPFCHVGTDTGIGHVQSLHVPVPIWVPVSITRFCHTLNSHM